MRTFDAEIRGASLVWAVIVPPVAFWVLVQVFAAQAGEGVMPAGRVMLLVALAQALPLAALGWMLASTAAYSVRPGCLVRHSVLRDREYALATGAEVAAERDGAIVVRGAVAGSGRARTLRLRVRDAGACFASLREATAASPSG
jgi:hypothetical protein